ncbi:MAG: RIP metalloprotease RseP [Robiginitomaculum sp.]|nr:MAG: RIP metalloprotease RseP [Robiginitomaculum sp.]
MLQFLINAVITVLSFGFVLGLLVFIHELGHYAVGRFFGVAVERFSVGFGKPVLRYKAKSGTEWVVSRIPLGGYVKFLGDAGVASNPDTDELAKIKAEMDSKHGKDVWKSCLHFKPLYQRALVAFAGPMANFILAAVLFAGLAWGFGIYKSTAEIQTVTPGGPAAQAGFVVGDKILTIDGKQARNVNMVIQIITLNSGERLGVEVLRGTQKVDLVVTPERREKKDGIGGRMTGGVIDVRIGGTVVHQTYNLPEAAKYGVDSVGNTLSSTLYYIGRIFRGKENGKALGGPVKILAFSGKIGVMSTQVEGGVGAKALALFANLLSLAAMLSVGLGFANLMPIPVLDGGHLMYYGYEAVMRRPLSARAQEIGFRVGFAVLITLFVVLTFNDIGYVSSLFEKTG